MGADSYLAALVGLKQSLLGEARQDMNIILCGMMGAGKTTVGIQLALLSDRCWMDTDNLIAKDYGEITTIFERYGEEYFRKLETRMVEELVEEDNLVVSVGGGLVLKEENVSLLKENGKIFYLRASVDTLTERLKADTTRPLLQTDGESLTDKLTRMLEERAPIYERVADFTIDVEGKTPGQIALEIMMKMDGNL